MSSPFSSDKSDKSMSPSALVSGPVHGLQHPHAKVGENQGLFESGHVQDDGSEGSVSEERLHDASSISGCTMDQSPIEQENLYINKESQIKQIKGISLGDTLKQRNLRSSTRMPKNRDETTTPENIVRKAAKIPMEQNKRISKYKTSKPRREALLSRTSSGEITRVEAVLEFKQCVSLLEKYGIVTCRKLFRSQRFLPRVPHPGYVGDGVRSKRCKTCRAIEDANNTVICDECQEVFHLSCCLPRVGYKHFDKEDNWYCSSCRKHKRRMDSVQYFRIFDALGSVCSAGPRYNSKVRLGAAHQADVPSWTGKLEDSAGSCCIGHHVSMTQEAKGEDKEYILKMHNQKLESSTWLPAKMLSPGTPENWLRCQSIFVKAYNDRDGRKHSEVICGKWRRAPINLQQSDHWECFCVIEWDPRHADCAVPQELPTEEIMQRLQSRSVVSNGLNR